jgi:hypothetical protein
VLGSWVTREGSAVPSDERASAEFRRVRIARPT